MSAEKPLANQPESSPEQEEQPVNPENLEQQTPEEETPGQQTPERQPEEVYKNIADTYIDSYAGDISDEERANLQANILERIKNIQVSTKDELVKEYESIIAGLKHYAESRKEAETPVAEAEAQNVAETEPEEGASPEQVGDELTPADKKRNFVMRALIGANRWTGGKILMAQSWISEKRAKNANKYIQQEGESDEEYDKRMRRVGTRVNLAVVAIGGAFLGYQAARHLGLDLNPFDNGGAGNSGDKKAEGQPPIDGDTNHDGKLDPNELLELSNASHRAETDFLNTNGRHGNDFNDISGDELKNSAENLPPGYDALMDQYNASPRELAAQLDQFRDLGIKFPDDIAELNRQPGEEYTAYVDRITDAMHNNQGLHDQAVQFAGDQLADKKAVPLDSPYRSAYIEPDGKGGYIVKWDDYVESPDPNDQIIMLGDGKGIRLPCGQPIELIPQEAPAPAAPIYYEQQPAGQGGAPVENPGGQGGETPSNPGHPETPVNPPTPGPETPVTPDDQKDWSKVPNLDGVTPLPLDQDTTPLTDQPTPGDNGTSSPDFQPGAPNSTPGTDTGPDVSAPGATPGNNTETGNNPEPGMNNNGGDKPQPNGTFDDNNL